MIITEEMEMESIRIDGRDWLKLPASKLPAHQQCVKHPVDQFFYRASACSGMVYIPLSGNLSNYKGAQ